MSTIISFGHGHVHKISGHILDNTTLARVNSRQHAFELFGRRWSFEYTEKQAAELSAYFPNGIVDLTGEEPNVHQENPVAIPP